MDGCLLEEHVHPFLIIVCEVVRYRPDLEVDQVLQVAHVLQPLLVIQLALVVLVDQKVGIATEKCVQVILVACEIGMRTLLLFVHGIVEAAVVWPAMLESALVVCLPADVHGGQELLPRVQLVDIHPHRLCFGVGKATESITLAQVIKLRKLHLEN